MGESHFLAGRLGPGEPQKAAGTAVLALGGHQGKGQGPLCGTRHKNVPECFSGRGCHWVLEALPGVGELLAVDAEGRMSTWDSHDPDPAVSGGGNERQSDFFEATQPSIPSLCLSPHVAAAFIL